MGADAGGELTVRRLPRLQSVVAPVCGAQTALAGTEMAQEQCGTIRLRLLTIGAQVRLTARKIWISMAAGHPAAAVLAAAHRKLMGAMPLRS